ncbi:glycosyltransferase family 4 protein [Cyclobacterium sp. 1_MG-2023]|uniref:glycosyltransferase family 4 protein n=1 Tax=Cyclobacterium sp. 1_MG-2023 TaxID=3062681 RepID=UPI0026E34A4D|nr:glycosyltransferase family 4 protein [Cyclobacterium sp. 1_MG-2023]MDO6440359.1 glycosyltransferase family 4 protein [Cyclobacterium sp. 1_MG-2023]
MILTENKKSIVDKKLKVLFVSSGNLKNFDVAPFIKVQGDSLNKENVEVDYFKVSGKGLKGYISNIGPLKKLLKDSDYDLIHAHFTLSAWVAVLSFPNIPIILSLMGTDAYGRISDFKKKRFYFNYFTFLTLLIQPFTKRIVSKSPNIEKFVWQKKKSKVLPNGVDINKFYPVDHDFRKELGLIENKKYALFLGNHNDPRKNYQLLEKAREELTKADIEIIAPYPIPHHQVFQYLNSVDVLVMCSYEEGSPNVVKEGMACNCKGVFTDVGDVRYLLEDTEGYAITGFDPIELAEKIKSVVEMKECKGRERLIELKLDLPLVAEKLKKIYLSTLA